MTFRDKIVVVGHINTARRSKAFVLSGTQWLPLPDLKHHRNGAACAVYQVFEDFSSFQAVIWIIDLGQNGGLCRWKCKWGTNL